MQRRNAAGLGLPSRATPPLEPSKARASISKGGCQMLEGTPWFPPRFEDEVYSNLKCSSNSIVSNHKLDDRASLSLCRNCRSQGRCRGSKSIWAWTNDRLWWHGRDRHPGLVSRDPSRVGESSLSAGGGRWTLLHLHGEYATPSSWAWSWCLDLRVGSAVSICLKWDWGKIVTDCRRDLCGFMWFPLAVWAIEHLDSRHSDLFATVIALVMQARMLSTWGPPQNSTFSREHLPLFLET